MDERRTEVRVRYAKSDTSKHAPRYLLNQRLVPRQNPEEVRDEGHNFFLQPDERTGLYHGRVATTREAALSQIKEFFSVFNKDLVEYKEKVWDAIDEHNARNHKKI